MVDLSHSILGLHGWGALAVVFALPALEASVFLGFVFPGEIAVLLGGVLAFQHRASLPAVIAAGIAGAIIGDTIGYAVGRRFGERVLAGSLGRFVRAEHLERGKAYLARRGGRAVLLGRWTAALRALVPGLAGMSGVPYRRFLAFNVAGGALWATTFVLLGYGAGDSWRHVASDASTAGAVIVGALAVAVVGGALVRRALRRRSRGAAVLVRSDGGEEVGPTEVGA